VFLFAGGQFLAFIVVLFIAGLSSGHWLGRLLLFLLSVGLVLPLWVLPGDALPSSVRYSGWGNFVAGFVPPLVIAGVVSLLIRLSPSIGSFLRHAAVLLGAYGAAWTCSFALMFWSRDESPPWDLLISYFCLSWTFRAGEIPFFIWLWSLIAFLPLAVLSVFVVRRFDRLRVVRFG
jgi:hypothetical protein